ncbi:MAG: ABC transporter substrate-binding protein [Deltaproteobacteria bacterium]|nr:MAG: ABC transporter substrate-binding protein [Deltaproteobacteria bacterium]
MALRDAPLAAALIGAGAVGVAALGTGSTLAYFEESLPTSMNPLYASAMVDYRSQELVFDRLWYHDAVTNELRSRVVEAWELTEGGKGVKITLKSGIKWHDGKPLTSKDLCFTVDAMLDPGTPSPVAEGYREFLVGCDTQGNSVATVTFNRVFHNPRERLGFSILPEHVFDSTAISPDLEFSARPIGTGPMKGSRGRRGALFDAFANVHHTPQIAQLQLQDAGDPLVQIKTIINNGVQGIIAVPPPYRPDLSNNDEVALKSYDLRSWWFIAINTRKGELADQRVRKGLNYAIDRTDLREKTIGVKPGEENSPCEFISGPFVQSSPYYNRSVPTVDRSDKAKAREYFEAAGLKQVGGRWHYKNQPISLRIGMLTPLNNEAPDLLSQVGNQLGAAGFDRQEFKISADEWKRQVLTGQATDYDLLIGKWSFGLYEEVNHLFHTRKGKEGKLNIFNYSNAAVDATLAEYDKAITDTAARDAYHKLHEQLAEDLPYLFLWKLDTKSAWRTEVRGNIITPYYYFTEIDAWKYGR